MGLFRKLFRRSKPPSPPQLPEPPKPQEILDVIDELTGTEAVTVTGADGKKRRVIRRLPRTKEEEALFKKGQEIMQSSMNAITNLYQYDPASVIDFAPIIETFANINQERADSLAQIADLGNIAQEIDNFRRMQSDLMQERFLADRNRLEEDLAHKGLASSTTGREERNLLNRSERLAQSQADLDALRFGESLADQRLSRNSRVFELQEADRANRLQASQMEYDLALQRKADLEQMRQNAIREQQNQFALASGIVEGDSNKAMKSRANTDALAQMQIANGVQLGNYNANINRLTQQHNMAMEAFKNRQPGFGDMLMNAASAGLGAFSEKSLGGLGASLTSPGGAAGTGSGSMPGGMGSFNSAFGGSMGGGKQPSRDRQLVNFGVSGLASIFGGPGAGAAAGQMMNKYNR